MAPQERDLEKTRVPGLGTADWRKSERMKLRCDKDAKKR